MKDACAGHIQVGNHFVHIDETHIHYKVPKASSTMRIAALNTFRQMVIANGYDFMNFKTKISTTWFDLSTPTIITCITMLLKTVPEFLIYHFFSCVMLIKNLLWPTTYPKNTEESSRKLLPTVTMSGIPKRIVSPYGPSRIVLAHPLPEKPILSRFTKPPKDLPLDFYNQAWFGKLPFSQQQTIPDLTQVAFLTDPKSSLLAKNHLRYDPEEKLSDHQFNKFYLAKNITQYHLDIDEEDEGSKDKADNVVLQEYMESGEVIEGGVIDLEAKSDGDGYLEDGEWGNYYKSDKDPNYEDNEDYSSEEGDDGQEGEADEEMNEDNDDYFNYSGNHLTDAEQKEIDEEQMF
ncbi:hypothetical protein VP01_333g9 [Puccinia sorghi]|uniref:Uncharacterized protein n=1 Tax=Puccinia sorghi TaxID=27349 RepID=A0A0L6UX47_9BASI|nr:hypothetical protein VP01_333g9 [Puccinia sorghi]